MASSIRSVISSDGGTNWTAEAGERLAGGGSYNSPRVIVLEDGRWRLYCSSRGVGIISSISQDDGRTFEPEPGTRVAPSTAYEAVTALGPVAAASARRVSAAPASIIRPKGRAVH